MMPGGDWTDVLHQKIDRLEAELAAERAKVALAAEAVNAFQPFYQKLTEVFALRFPMCGECADEWGTCPSRNGLPCKWPTLPDLRSSYALAEIRRAAARECIAVLTDLAESRDADTDFDRGARNNLTHAAKVIAQKFGVTA